MTAPVVVLLVTMGMLRDDPGGHFQKGYSDGAAGEPFQPTFNPTEIVHKRIGTEVLGKSYRLVRGRRNRCRMLGLVATGKGSVSVAQFRS